MGSHAAVPSHFPRRVATTRPPLARCGRLVPIIRRKILGNDEACPIPANGRRSRLGNGGSREAATGTASTSGPNSPGNASPLLGRSHGNRLGESPPADDCLTPYGSGAAGSSSGRPHTPPDLARRSGIPSSCRPYSIGDGCNPGAAQTGDRVTATGSFRHLRPYQAPLRSYPPKHQLLSNRSPRRPGRAWRWCRTARPAGPPAWCCRRRLDAVRS
jgi:hypothetical protein